jgi:Gpi18-like mannosyltransferase
LNVSAQRLSQLRLSQLRWSALRMPLATWFIPSVLVPFLSTRLAILVIAEVVALSLAHLTDQGPVRPPTHVTSWFSILLSSDADWYLRIAADWYQYDVVAGATSQQSVAFFPLYPLLVRVFNAIIGGRAATLPISALIVANAAALGGLAALYALARSEFGRAVARRSVWYMLAFPVSFYLSAAYAEPVFLVACVVAVWAARSDRWLIAGVAGAAAALSRPYGVAIVVPLGFEFVRQRWTTPRRLLDPRVLWLILPVVALGGWMVYLYQLSGDPLVFVHTQVAWTQQQMPPWQTLAISYGRARDQQLQGRVDLGTL